MGIVVMDVCLRRLCLHSILLLPPVNRCIGTIYVCVWRMFVV